jgi:hypothetical protein
MNNNNNTKLSAGDWVEVRSKDEILKTLDQHGRLEELPFMPEMFALCGKRFRVYKRAHKTCDTVTGDYKARRLPNAVHLEGIRCGGEAHGGCQASCLVFWKEAWLKRVPEASASAENSPGWESLERTVPSPGCREEDVWAGTHAPATEDAEDPIYVCQATQVPVATRPLSSWDIWQYIEDWTSGNIGLARMARGFLFVVYRSLVNAGIGLGRPLRWLYDSFQRVSGGVPYPLRVGKLPIGGRTPTAKLGLQVGEWVRVKSYEEILATCDQALRNRGMSFDKEMVPYCGKTYRILKRVTKIINEKTGKLQQMKNPCYILESVICQSRYSECRLFCPRSIYPYWREIWLERVSGNSKVGETPKGGWSDGSPQKACGIGAP